MSTVDEELYTELYTHMDRLAQLFDEAKSPEPFWPLWCEATGLPHYEFLVPLSFVRPELGISQLVDYCPDCMSYLEVSA